MSDRNTDRDSFQSSATKQGAAFEDHVERVLIANGYRILHQNWTHPRVGVEIDFVVKTPDGSGYVWIEAKGSWASPSRNGLERTDTLKKALASAWLLSSDWRAADFVIVTTNLPKPGSVGERWLEIAVDQAVVADVWLLPLGFDSIFDNGPVS